LGHREKYYFVASLIAHFSIANSIPTSTSVQ